MVLWCSFVCSWCSWCSSWCSCWWCSSWCSCLVVLVMFVAVLVMFVAASMAAVMMPTVPPLPSAVAKTAAEFVADDVPARAVPAVFVPTVGIAVVLELIIAASSRHSGWRRRRRRSGLPKVRIVRFARRYELRIDLRQRLGGTQRLRLVLHDRPDAVHEKSVAGFDSAEHKSRLPTSLCDLIARPALSRLCGSRQARRQQCEPEQPRRQTAWRRRAAI